MTRREELEERAKRLGDEIINCPDDKEVEVALAALLQVERECWDCVFDRVEAMVVHFDEHEEVKAYALRMRDWCRAQKEGL